MKIELDRALEALKTVLNELGLNSQHTITLKGPDAEIELKGDEIAENIIFELKSELMKEK